MPVRSAATSPNFAPDLRTLEETLGDRIRGLEKWLRENAPECVEEQRHLNQGTPERVYWHYGYLVALRDVRGFFLRRCSELH
jgi:hypothetical protein